MNGISVKEFIKELQKYPNQDAILNFISNVINVDNDAFDTEYCDVDLFQQDVEDALSYDIMISLNEETRKKREEKFDESIVNLLSRYGKLRIELNNEPLSSSSIVILNENDEVLREIAVGGRHRQEDNVGIILSSIIN